MVLMHDEPIPKNFAEFKGDLRPELHAQHSFHVQLFPNHQPHIRIAENLVATLVIALPFSQVGTHFEPFEQWRISFDEALQIAKENLRQQGLQFSRRGHLYSFRGELSASQMLLTNEIRSLNVAGDPIALPCNKNTLFVVGSTDHDRLAAVTRAIRNRPFRRVEDICVPYRLVGDQWEFYRPAENDESFEVLHELELQSLEHVYAEQKWLLESDLCEQSPIMAPYVTTWHKSGRLRSYCTWPEAGETLLPRTDFIAFERSAALGSRRRLGRAAWASVQSFAGHLMVPQGMCPERWLVNGHPSQEVLERLGLARS